MQLLIEKAELLPKTFVKVHSSENLSSAAKQCRDYTLAKNPGVTERKTTSAGMLDLLFTI